jgi:hypothetical protein
MAEEFINAESSIADTSAIADAFQGVTIDGFSADVDFDVVEEDVIVIVDELPSADSSTIYVKAVSKDDLIAVIEPFGLVRLDDTSNKHIRSTEDIGVDDIGKLTDVDGYHINVRKVNDNADAVIVALEAADMIIDPPATPHRKFA